MEIQFPWGAGPGVPESGGGAGAAPGFQAFAPGVPALMVMEGSRASVPPCPAHMGTHRQTATLPNRSLGAGGPSLPDNSVAGAFHGSPSIFWVSGSARGRAGS